MSRLSKTFVAVLSAAALGAPAAHAQVQHFASPPSPATATTTSTPELLKQARRAFDGRSAADLTPLLRELAARLPSLRGSERRDARTVLLRPTDGEEWQFAVTYDRDTVIECALPLIARTEPLTR